jgi:hypothetical protein
MSTPAVQPHQLWRLDPRDPAVLGDGRGSLAYVTGAVWPFPFPGTVAGMVRAHLLEGGGRVIDDEAARAILKEVAIRGPWLVDPEDNLWFPTPADLRIDSISKKPIPPKILDIDDPELKGAYGSRAPGAPELPGLCQLPERDKDGNKHDSPRDAFWSLPQQLCWALGDPPDSAKCEENILSTETRIHVVLDDKTGTAEPNQLYATAGFRLCEGWRLAVEVRSTHERRLEGTRWAQLGGRGRRAFLEIQEPPGPGTFPTWDSVCNRYESSAEGKRGLRLQLLSPAYLPERALHHHGDPAWCPSWLRPRPGVHEGVHAGIPPQLRGWAQEYGLHLRLHAVCIPGHAVVSGWNQRGRSASKGPSVRRGDPTGAPREIRRLVPTGSVYYLTLHDRAGRELGEPDRKKHLLEVCNALWGAFLDPEGPAETTDPDLHNFRAPPTADGYGMLLPGYWS